MHRLFRVALALTLLIIAGTLAGCGKKGDLEPPGGKPDSYPKQYPDPASL